MASLKNLAIGTFGSHWRRGVMVFLNAYFDASKDKNGNRVVVAGYAGQAEHFLEIEERWNNFLAVDRLEYFHFHDLFDRFTDWRPVVEKYAELLSETKLYGVIAMVDERAWSHIDRHEVYCDTEKFPRSEHVCLDLALTTMANCLAENQPTEQVTIFIDNDYGDRALAAGIYDQWVERTGQTFDAFTVAEPGASRRFVPLQFADLLANAYRWEPIHWTPIYNLTSDIIKTQQTSPFRNAVKHARQTRLRWEDD